MEIELENKYEVNFCGMMFSKNSIDDVNEEIDLLIHKYYFPENGGAVMIDNDGKTFFGCRIEVTTWNDNYRKFVYRWDEIDAEQYQEYLSHYSQEKRIEEYLKMSTKLSYRYRIFMEAVEDFQLFEIGTNTPLDLICFDNGKYEVLN